MTPVFVGGTGRSGTTVTARLIDAHPDFFMLPTEVRFIAARGGLCDLIEGRTDLKRFEKKLLGRWFDPTPGSGLHRVADRATLEAILRQHRAGLKSDPEGTAAAFTHDLLDPVAAARGVSTWVEMTPANALAAPMLLRLFPDMRLVHSVRDGRDVACSVTPLKWGPTDADGALDWWAAKVDRCFVASASLPDDRLHVVQMEELIERERDREYARLLTFLGVEDDPVMRAYFDASVTPERAHIGRWRHDIPPDRQAAFDDHYWRLAADLIARGRPYVPDRRTATA